MNTTEWAWEGAGGPTPGLTLDLSGFLSEGSNFGGKELFSTKKLTDYQYLDHLANWIECDAVLSNYYHFNGLILTSRYSPLLVNVFQL